VKAMVEMSVEERQWEKVTVDEATRMRLNGESAQCMAHIRAIKKAGGVSLKESDGSDTSKDQAWTTDESGLSVCAARYCMITTALWMLPKMLVLFLPVLLLQIPGVVWVRCYVACLRPGTESVERTAMFWVSFAVVFFLYLPAGILAVVSLMLDYVFYWIFGITFCVCTCRYGAVWRSMKAIHPYRNGPWILLHLPDIYVSVIGQTCRQGMLEVLWLLSNMWLIMPWYKYYMNCNPWLDDLDHRFVNQISTTCADINASDPTRSAKIGREIISRAKHFPGRAQKVDLWHFVPHYPYPPPGRRYAMGMQQGGSGMKSCMLMVHTTHANRADGNCTEQHVASNCCKVPVYRVMLWYNNPYHHFTGWVEAHPSTGEASQLDKADGGEHPMWLVGSKSPLTSKRTSMTGPGSIDKFFDDWIPVFAHEVRYSHHRMEGKSHEEALKIANDKYQEVASADGISRPLKKIGLDKYKESSMHDYGLV